jgi:hypothetical protein
MTALAFNPMSDSIDVRSTASTYHPNPIPMQIRARLPRTCQGDGAGGTGGGVTGLGVTSSAGKVLGFKPVFHGVYQFLRVFQLR